MRSFLFSTTFSRHTPYVTFSDRPTPYCIILQSQWPCIPALSPPTERAAPTPFMDFFIPKLLENRLIGHTVDIYIRCMGSTAASPKLVLSCYPSEILKSETNIENTDASLPGNAINPGIPFITIDIRTESDDVAIGNVLSWLYFFTRVPRRKTSSQAEVAWKESSLLNIQDVRRCRTTQDPWFQTRLEWLSQAVRT